MRIRGYAAAIGMAATVLSLTVHGQTTDLKQVIHDMANSLGMLRSVQEVDSLMTVEDRGTGTMRDVGPTAIGPSVPLKSYYAQIAYDFPGMRVDITPMTGQRQIQVVSGTFAWNEMDKIGGGLDPAWASATPAIDAVAVRLLRLWTTPFGVVKAAAAAGDRTKVTMEGGATIVTFPLVNGMPEQTVNMVVGDLNGTPVKVTLNRDHRPERVEVRYRDRTFVTTYTNYGDLNDADYRADIFLPRRTVQTVDGQSVLDLTITKSNTYNPYVIMPVPEAVQKAGTR